MIVSGLNRLIFNTGRLALNHLKKKCPSVLFFVRVCPFFLTIFLPEPDISKKHPNRQNGSRLANTEPIILIAKEQEIALDPVCNF